MTWKRYSEETHRGPQGPHQGLEVELMLTGKKPIAEIGDSRMHEVESYIKDGTLIHHRFEFISNPGLYGNIVGLPHEAKRMKMLVKEFQKPTRDHARIGLLLGYSKNDIRYFINVLRHGNRIA